MFYTLKCLYQVEIICVTEIYNVQALYISQNSKLCIYYYTFLKMQNLWNAYYNPTAETWFIVYYCGHPLLFEKNYIKYYKNTE